MVVIHWCTMEHFEKIGLTVNEAILRILALRAKFQAEGNVDSEHDVINSILTQLTAGAITPAAAVAQAEGLDQSRIER